MNSEHIVDTVGPLRGFAKLPRAIWVGGGLLSLVTAGLAGALVMKSVQPAAQAEELKATPVASAVVAMPASVNRSHLSPTNAAPEGNWNAPSPMTHTVACTACGTVESVGAVQVKGQGTGLGAVAGGVLGGVVGHQVGGGNGKTAMTILGAVGGGIAGNEVERRTRSETAFDVHVRMDDGSRRVLRQAQAQAVAVGAHVVVEGNRVRVATEKSTGEPRITRTSAPNERGT